MFTISTHIIGNEDIEGVYVCSVCDNVLFEAAKKFNAGCGFPSFWAHAEDGVKQSPLHTYNRSRIQLLCSACNAHLGHLFSHKHTPTNLRYCINTDAIKFQSSGNKASQSIV